MLAPSAKRRPPARQVDLRKVNWEVMKPWIARRVTELLGGLEDEVLIAYIYEQLEGKRVRCCRL